MLSKKIIHEYCLQLLSERIKGITQSIEDARAASNNDTKSSMGDKYETTREMMQIELDKLGKQLVETQQMALGLKVLDPTKRSEQIEQGSLVFTEKALFYLTVGLGKVSIPGNNENTTVMVVSPASPIGKVMLHKKPGDRFEVNGVFYSVKSIE